MEPVEQTGGSEEDVVEEGAIEEGGQSETPSDTSGFLEYKGATGSRDTNEGKMCLCVRHGGDTHISGGNYLVQQ